MGRDVEIADPRVVGEHGIQGRELVSGAGAAIEDVRDGDGGDGPAGDGFREGGVEFGGPIAFAEFQQAGSMAGQRLPAQGQRLDEVLSVGTRGSEQVASAQFVGVALLPDEGGDMSGVLDGLSSLVTARMACHLGHAIDDADDVFGGDEGQNPSDLVVRDRVMVALEADVGGLAGGDPPDVFALELVFGQGEQTRAFLLQRVGDEPTGRISGDLAGVGDVRDPAGELEVEIIQGVEGAGREERGT